LLPAPEIHSVDCDGRTEVQSSGESKGLVCRD